MLTVARIAIALMMVMLREGRDTRRGGNEETSLVKAF